MPSRKLKLRAREYEHQSGLCELNEELVDAKQGGDPVAQTLAPQTVDEAVAALADLLKDGHPKVCDAVGKQFTARLNEVWKQRRKDGVPTRPEPEQPKKKRRRQLKGLPTSAVVPGMGED